MSFDFNQISTFKPKVENTFLNKGGGGGNTGYFQQERKKKEEKPIMSFLSDDKLEKMADGELPNEVEPSETDLIQKVKGFIKKII